MKKSIFSDKIMRVYLVFTAIILLTVSLLFCLNCKNQKSEMVKNEIEYFLWRINEYDVENAEAMRSEALILENENLSVEEKLEIINTISRNSRKKPFPKSDAR